MAFGIFQKEHEDISIMGFLPFVDCEMNHFDNMELKIKWCNHARANTIGSIS